MNDFLNDNKCVSCTYAKVIQVFEVKKSEHLVFWSGDYQSLIFSATLVNPTKVFVTSLAFSCLISVPVN
jgi:hypothetical protein